MTWFQAVPAVLAAVGWLVFTGLPTSYALGIRGIAAAALAPVYGIALVALTAVVAARLGVAWSIGLTITVCLAVATVIGAAAYLLRHRVRVVTEPDPRPMTLAAAAGLLPAAVLGGLTVLRGFGRPDNLSQTYDALFHYNAVALILDSHNGSSLGVASFGSPGTPASFYPAAWHDLAALVVAGTGVSIPVAANVLSAVIAALLWPLSCVFLARQIFGRSPGALAVTGVLSVAFTAGPWGLLGFGVLWPNALGLAIMPAGLAVLLSAVRLAKEDALGRRRAAVSLPVVAVAATFAHPGALFGLVVLGVFPAGHALLRRALRLRQEGRTWRGVAEVAVAVAGLGAVWYWTATTHNPAFESVRNTYWAPFETPLAAVREAVLNATNGRDALWLLSAVVLVGMLASIRPTERRWLVPAWAATAVLYVLSASVNRPQTRKFTGYWYNDSYRLAAMLPVTAVPLAVAGILWLATTIAARMPAGAPPRLAWLLGGPALAVVLVIVLAGATQALYQPERTDRLAGPYLRPPPGNVLASAEQRDFLVRVARRIPRDSVVANNPWDGSGMLWALAGRRTLFPHFTAPASTEAAYLAGHLSAASYDPEVCPAARRLHVDYLLIGDAQFWPADQRRYDYPGFADPRNRAGFELVETDGTRKLYRITACEPQTP